MTSDHNTERQRILDQVLVFLTEQFAGDDAEFDASTRFSEGNLVTSLEVLEVVMFLEKDFGLTLTHADLQYIETAESITDLILSKSSATN